MNRLPDILARKARLTERIAGQRAQLAGQLDALQPLFTFADRCTFAAQTLRRHPEWAAAAIGIVIALRPRRSLRWLRRGVIAWRAWKWAQGTLAAYIQPK